MDIDNLEDLKKAITSYLGVGFKIGLILVLFSSLFLFTNLTTELFDTPKFLVLIVFTGLMLVLITLKFTLSDKVVLVRTALDIPLLLLLAVAIVSTILSPSPYVSLLGSQLKIHGSLVSLISYVLFYFVLVNNLKNAKEVKWIFTLLIIASQALSVVTLLSYIGVKILPPPWTTAANFTTTGSSFSTTAVLALLLPFIVMRILNSTKVITIVLNSVFLLIAGMTIALTGTWATWIVALIALVISFFAVIPVNQIDQLVRVKPQNLVGLLAPLAIIALIVILSFVPPMGAAKNPIYLQAKNFSREAQLPFQPSWKISVSAFRDSPFWGTGPGTYAFDFTNYKPVEFNSLKIWNVRFDSSFNEYLQILATLGGIGLVAILSVTALFISSAYPILAKLIKTRSLAEQSSEPSDIELKRGLTIAGLCFFIILALHASTLVLWVIGITILASFMIIGIPEGLPKRWIGAETNIKNIFLKIAANVTQYDTSKESIKIDALPGILLTITIALVLFAGYFGGKFVLADYHHRLALNAVGRNDGIAAYNELIAAEKLNPNNDSYRIDLAQTNFALANAVAAAKAPTEASPGGSLTDQDKQNIQVLLQQSITEGRSAVTLSPKSATDWEILALLYRQIAGVAQNALVFSLDSYGRAILQDPLNPALRVSVGGVYYAAKNYDMAIRFFTDAINLKADYANGYYNLSVALRDKGDLANAESLAEKLLTMVDKSSSDYKTVNDYIADLKNRIATQAQTGGQQANEEVTQPPAAETKGSLQQKELPKVINLPQPEKIATPAAIKKPANTPIPSPSESPTPTQ